MAQERGGRALVAATAVVMMVTMPMLFHCQVAEADGVPVADTIVAWNLDDVFGKYPNGVDVLHGSKLVFVSDLGGKPNVTEVETKDEFINCNGEKGTPFSPDGAELTSNRTIYFICIVGDHCKKDGMKIQVNAQ